MSDAEPVANEQVEAAEKEVIAAKLPTDNSEDALPFLRRPFTPHAVKWKIQSASPKEGDAKWALIVGYIDARLVVERLNTVVGGCWSEKPVRIEGQGNALMYELTVLGQTHIDVGIGQGQDAEMKLKAVHSDALKRTAVRFGIGVSLYAMPQFWLPVAAEEHEEGGAPTIERIKGGNKKGRPGFLKDVHEAFLRSQYTDWLEREGNAKFGEPLDHGDAPGSVGDLAEGTQEESEAAKNEPLRDDKAIELGDAARLLRDEIRAIDPDALAQQTFDNALSEREHSHERLEDFVFNLEELQTSVERFTELSLEAEKFMDAADLKALLDRAKRRASRSERVRVLEEALAEIKGGGGRRKTRGGQG